MKMKKHHITKDKLASIVREIILYYNPVLDLPDCELLTVDIPATINKQRKEGDPSGLYIYPNQP